MNPSSLSSFIFSSLFLSLTILFGLHYFYALYSKDFHLPLLTLILFCRPTSFLSHFKEFKKKKIILFLISLSFNLLLSHSVLISTAEDGNWLGVFRCVPLHMSQSTIVCIFSDNKTILTHFIPFKLSGFIHLFCINPFFPPTLTSSKLFLK